MTSEENFFKKLFDRNEIFEIDPDLLRVLTPAEISEVDQLLAMRFNVVEAAMGVGKELLTAQTIEHCVERLSCILKKANRRLDSGKQP